MTQLTFTIPKPLWLTSNRHITDRAYLQRTRRSLHDLARLEAVRTGLATITGPVAAHWLIRYPKGVSWTHGDAANAQPTTKALLDGLVPRWLPGDGPRWVTSETFERGPNITRTSDHDVTLTLTPTTRKA